MREHRKEREKSTAVWKEYLKPTRNGCFALFIKTFLSVGMMERGRVRRQT